MLGPADSADASSTSLRLRSTWKISLTYSFGDADLLRHRMQEVGHRYLHAPPHANKTRWELTSRRGCLRQPCKLVAVRCSELVLRQPLRSERMTNDRLLCEAIQKYFEDQTRPGAQGATARQLQDRMGLVPRHRTVSSLAFPRGVFALHRGKRSALDGRFDRLLKSKGVPERLGGPTEKFTLPAIEVNETTIMDSWSIAEYLEDSFPEGPPLFPYHSKPLARAANTLLIPRSARPVFKFLLPRIIDYLDEKGAEYFRRTREQEFGPILYESAPDEAAIEAMWKAAAPVLQRVGAMLEDNPEGPYFLGETRSYADLCIVALLHTYKVVYNEAYHRIVSISPPLGRLYDACSELL